MKKRHPNPRLVKIHRSYTVEEIAKRFGIHKNTVRHWIKEGLAAIIDKRPMLIQGIVLAEFLGNRRKKNKQPCKPGELYCVRCRAPKLPAAFDDKRYFRLIPKRLHPNFKAGAVKQRYRFFRYFFAKPNILVVT